MRPAMVALVTLALCLAACVGVQTETVRQGAYAALSDYDAALAAADTYLCTNAGDFSQPCVPKPDCTSGASGSTCVEPGLRTAIQTTVTGASSYVETARKLAAEDTLSSTDETKLASLASLLSTVTATLRAQVITGKDAAATTAASPAAVATTSSKD